MKILISLILAFASIQMVQAADWEGPKERIEHIWAYPTYLIVQQKTKYGGKAGCKDSEIFSISWDDFDEEAGHRIYSSFLSAYLAEKPIRAVFHDGSCGEEGQKRFAGHFEM